MKTAYIYAASALLLSAPVSAFAQSADATYCKALGDKYQEYVQGTGRRGEAAPNVSSDIALSKCQTAPAEAIPTLEKVLRDAKVTLPPRT
jgi:hypothetical protein